MTARLFVPMRSFFPNRHQTFIRQLYQNFSLIVHDSDQWAFPAGETVDTAELIKKMGDITDSIEFKSEWEQYKDFMLDTLNGFPGLSPSQENAMAYLESTKPILADTLKSALLFSEVAKTTAIDAVVTSTDYTRHARPIVYMAQQLGIPTIHIEHGLFAMKPNPPAGRENDAMAPFASNYVILDNQLEVDIFNRRSLQPSVKALLPLGTPLDNATSGKHCNRAEARKSLGIEQESPCIAVGLSWREPHGPHALFHGPASEVSFVRAIFETISHSKWRDDIKIIIKLHPAVADFGQFASVRNYFTQLAMDCGLSTQTLILVDRLPEVIAAADVMITQTYSSILWDCVLQHTPTALALPSLWTQGATDSPTPISAASKAGLLNYLHNSTDLLEMLKTSFRRDRQVEFQSLTDSFFKKWNIHSESAAVKSKRIINWLQELL